MRCGRFAGVFIWVDEHRGRYSGAIGGWASGINREGIRIRLKRETKTKAKQ